MDICLPVLFASCKSDVCPKPSGESEARPRGQSVVSAAEGAFAGIAFDCQGRLGKPFDLHCLVALTLLLSKQPGPVRKQR